jgi:lysophospholipase L1-like esterase
MNQTLRKLLGATSLALLIGSSAWADEPFRAHRYDSFKACEVTSESIVFIGNSITNMGEWWEHFSANPVVVNRGNSGCYSYESLDELESVLIGRPRAIFVMVGTNDIGGLVGEPADVAANTRQIINRIQRESPNTQIFITSVFPSTNGYRNLTNLGEINSLLKPLCEETNVNYVDLWDDLMGIVNGGGLSLDALHVNPKGYKIWAEKVAPLLDGLTSVFNDSYMTLNQSGLSYAYGMRSQLFGVLPVKSDDVLIIGDEMVHGGEWHELLHSSRVKGRGIYWGYGGCSLSQYQTMLTAILETNSGIKQCPKQIYLYMNTTVVNGTSDLATEKTNYEAVITEAKRLAPNAEIYILSATPHANSTYNTRSASFNTKLKEIADATDGVNYVDLYTTLTAGTDIDSNNYVTATGYHHIAQILAKTIGDDVTVDTDEQFSNRYATINARQIVGRAIDTATLLPQGTTTGTWSASALAPLTDKIDAAYTLLAADDASLSELQSLGSELSTATTTARQAINQPVEGKWYTITTPRRSSYYTSLTDAATVVGVADNAKSTAAQWAFEPRTDGTFNIVNRCYGTYISPSASSNSAVKAVKDAPSQGWTLTASSTTGLYIITSGTTQLNQTNASLGAYIYNWGYGSVTTGEFNNTDTGCEFCVTELPDDASAIDPDKIVNDPTPSTATEIYWHTFSTPLRDSRYLYENTDNTLYGGADSEADKAMWKILTRTDGSYDIVNRASGRFIDPSSAAANSQLSTSATSPAAGWQFLDAATDGYYIITSGTTQLNQTNSGLGYKIYNWGYGTATAGAFNTSDTGCQYLIHVADVETLSSSISEVAAPTPASTEAYDLLGRRLANPSATQLRISGGKLVR